MSYIGHCYINSPLQYKLTPLQTKISIENNIYKIDTEGITRFYKTLCYATLAYATKYRSMPRNKTVKMLEKSISIFEDYLTISLSDFKCMSSSELLEKRLMKRKHYCYAAYLAVISSFPILQGNIPCSETFKAVIAKIAEIVSIKTLDNVNDVFHTPEQAARSLKTQFQAFTSDSLRLPGSHDDIGRAENSTYKLAKFTNTLVSQATNRDGPAFTLYLKDFEKYIQGQALSMNQKLDNDIIDIREFLQSINEKAVGRVWITVDFCFLNSLWYFDMADLKTMEHVKTAIDLIFKGCNIYDDISDLQVDLDQKILNSVVLLALDNGLCDEHELHDNPSILKSKLESREAFYKALELGNLLFSMGLEELEKAQDYPSRIDIDALKYSTYILRIFSMRKWLTKQYTSRNLYKPFTLHVSDDVMDYEKYIK